MQSWRVAWVRASKREEKNREGKRKYTVRTSEGGEKVWSPIVWGLMQSWRVVWVRASKREEKNREGKRKYKVRKRVVNEKKKRVFVFTQVVFLSIVISI